MTDVAPDGLADLIAGTDPTDPPAVADALFTGKVCSWPEGCTTRLPGKDEAGFVPARKYCPPHSAEAAKKKGRKPTGDAAPSNVTVNLGSGSTGGRTAEDKRVAKVTAGATQMAKTLGTLLMVSGDQECGMAIIAGADSWGKAIGDLSRYQPVLAKIFAPTGEMTGQGLAWIAAIAATAGIVVPVMAHHNLIKPELAAKFTGTLGAVSGVAVVADDATAA